MTISVTERQLTFAPYGHTLHHIQVFSSDNQWIVYDIRNEDSQLAATSRIEMVHIPSGEIRVLYETTRQSAYGPGVGAATFSPVEPRVLFLHGIRNSDAEKPYDFTRRTGVAIDIDRPQEPIFLDARNIDPPFTAGALRGGTHAHSWSGDGKWISFTYNDFVMQQRSKEVADVEDLRMVGVMMPGRVSVPENETGENHAGTYFGTVVTRVTERPERGSDAINKAFDEGWIGQNGYQRKDGTWQHRAIAFQGNVLTIHGDTQTEVFVLDLPDRIDQPARKDEPLEGTDSTRPGLPMGVSQRRLTYTEKGIGGLRHWLRTSPDGALIVFLMADADGWIQVFGISPNGGEIRQLTRHAFSLQSGINFSPDGRNLAYVADNSIFVQSLDGEPAIRLTPRAEEEDVPVGTPVWSPNGQYLAFNRYVKEGDEKFLQIFVLERGEA